MVTSLARVAHARIIRPKKVDPEQAEDFLRRSIYTGLEVVRYRQTWHVGQLVPLGDNDVAAGFRIGYEAEGQGARWDPKKQDFVDEAQFEGRTYSMVVRWDSGTFAFARPKDRSPLSALQGLLNAAESGAQWRVEEVRAHEDWETWLERSERLVTFRATLRRPNPNYKDRDILEKAMEGANAATLQTVATAAKDDLDGLDPESEFIQQAREHVQDGYGNYTATADRQGRPTKFDSKKANEPLEIPVEASDSGHVSSETLAQALAQSDESRDDERTPAVADEDSEEV